MAQQSALPVVTVTGGNPPVVRVEYDGADPPRALVEALRADGWLPLAAVPPPASAIDWSSPDPRKPGRYAIGSYPAVSRGEWHGPVHLREEALSRAHALLAAAAQPAGAPHREGRPT